MSDVIIPNPDSMIHKAFTESGELMDTTINWLKHRNPYPFDTRIEYLESTGTQYVDTGIYYATPIEFQADVSVTQIDGSNCVFGCSTVTNRFSLGISQAGKVDLGMGSGAASPSLAQSIVLGQRYLFRYQLASRRTIWQDGTSLWTGDLQPAPSNVSIWAFGSRRGPSDSEAYMRSGDGWKGRIYSLKIMQGSGYPLVRDFIPVRVGQVGYLYDKVSLQLFANAGSGSFVLGPDL